jgi:hypothetical protein
VEKGREREEIGSGGDEGEGVFSCSISTAGLLAVARNNAAGHASAASVGVGEGNFGRSI